jgi:hypothetical protein
VRGGAGGERRDVFKNKRGLKRSRLWKKIAVKGRKSIYPFVLKSKSHEEQTTIYRITQRRQGREKRRGREGNGGWKLWREKCGRGVTNELNVFTWHLSPLNLSSN